MQCRVVHWKSTDWRFETRNRPYLRCRINRAKSQLIVPFMTNAVRTSGSTKWCRLYRNNARQKESCIEDVEWNCSAVWEHWENARSQMVTKRNSVCTERGSRRTDNATLLVSIRDLLRLECGVWGYSVLGVLGPCVRGRWFRYFVIPFCFYPQSIELCPVEIYVWPPLWSSGQSSWLQIQRSGFDFLRYQILWEVVGLKRGQLSLVSAIEELLETKSNGSGL
jgi:hypothetical protein